MTYDLDFRYRRALQPEGLTTVLTAIQAVADAVKDARIAGIDPEHDPAVALLACHVGRLAQPVAGERETPCDTTLQARCLERIAQLKSRPAIIALVRRAVEHDREAQRAYHHEAARALRCVAFNIGLARAQYDIHQGEDRFGIAGDVVMRGDALNIRITASPLRTGREITYRSARNKYDEFGGKPHQADIGQLADIPRLARRVAADLDLQDTGAQTSFI